MSPGRTRDTCSVFPVLIIPIGTLTSRQICHKARRGCHQASLKDIESRGREHHGTKKQGHRGLHFVVGMKICFIHAVWSEWTIDTQSTKKHFRAGRQHGELCHRRIRRPDDECASILCTVRTFGSWRNKYCSALNTNRRNTTEFNEVHRP